jgi:hypothetical protein
VIAWLGLVALACAVVAGVVIHDDRQISTIDKGAAGWLSSCPADPSGQHCKGRHASASCKVYGSTRKALDGASAGVAHVTIPRGAPVYDCTISYAFTNGPDTPASGKLNVCAASFSRTVAVEIPVSTCSGH